MHFFNDQIERRGKEFKSFVWEAIHDHRLTQSDIASDLGISQSDVSSWTNLNGDLHIPAFIIPYLPKALQVDVLVYLARQCDCVVTARPKVIGELNGKIDDEAMNLTAHLGRIAEMVASGRMDAKKARREIASMRSALDKAEAELEVPHVA